MSSLVGVRFRMWICNSLPRQSLKLVSCDTSSLSLQPEIFRRSKTMISSDNDHPEIRPRFWKRQFLGPATTPQIIFDVVFGIVGPVLCFVFDPVVFRGDFLGEP